MPSRMPPSVPSATPPVALGAGFRWLPIAVTSLVALGSIGLLVLGMWRGWLAPDVGRGDAFCEATHDHLKQPANTLSNLGFVVAGLGMAMRSGRAEGLGPPGSTMRRFPSLATSFACLVVALGPASAAMHATGSALGGRLDVASMHLVASFALAYALMRWRGRGPAFMAGAFVAVLAISQLATEFGPAVPVAMTSGNLAFGLTLIAALVTEWRVARTRGALDFRWALAAAGALTLAFALWQPSKTGGPLCVPDSMVQGHAVWHLLGALSTWFLFRFYVSRSTTRPMASPR